MLVHLAMATMLARGTRGEVKTLGGTRLSPIARALNEQIERERAGATGGESTAATTSELPHTVRGC